MKFPDWLRLSRRWLFLPPLLLGVGVVFVLVSRRSDLPRVDVPERTWPVRVVEAELTGIYPKVVGYGTASPSRIWSAVAEVPGRVVDVIPELRSGEFVEDGALLVQIDPTDYELRVEQRRADLAQAESSLQQLRINQAADVELLATQRELLQVLQAEVDRLKGLAARSVSSQSELEQAMTQQLQQSLNVQNLSSTLATFDQRLASEQASVEMARARLREAERDLERTRIVAPFAGMLSGATLEVGQVLAAGERLFQLLDTSFIEVEAQFSLAQLNQVLHYGSGRSTSEDPSSKEPSSDDLSAYSTQSNERPQSASVDGGDAGRSGAGSSDAGSSGDLLGELDSDSGSALTSLDTPLTGVRLLRESLSATIFSRRGGWKTESDAEVARLSDSIDRQTRTLGVVVRTPRFKSPEAVPMSLRPGAFCEVRLAAENPIVAVSLPRTCLDDDWVYVVDQSNRLQRRSVRPAFYQDDKVILASGIEPGERVVVNPPVTAADGDAVLIDSPSEANEEPGP